MLQNISNREKMLLAILAGVAFIVLNLWLGRLFISWRRDLAQERQHLEAQMAEAARNISERDRWDDRARWLQKSVLELQNADTAKQQLLQRVEAMANNFDITITNKKLNKVAREEYYLSISIELSVKAPWPRYVEFLHALQTPQEFLVVEALDLKADSDEPGHVDSVLQVARWYSNSENSVP